MSCRTVPGSVPGLSEVGAWATKHELGPLWHACGIRRWSWQPDDSEDSSGWFQLHTAGRLLLRFQGQSIIGKWHRDDPWLIVTVGEWHYFLRRTTTELTALAYYATNRVQRDGSPDASGPLVLTGRALGGPERERADEAASSISGGESGCIASHASSACGKAGHILGQPSIRTRCSDMQEAKAVHAGIDCFINDNSIDARAAAMLRAQPPDICQAALQAGPLRGAWNPSAALQVRIRKAQRAARSTRLEEPYCEHQVRGDYCCKMSHQPDSEPRCVKWSSLEDSLASALRDAGAYRHAADDSIRFTGFEMEIPLLPALQDIGEWHPGGAQGSYVLLPPRRN